MTCERAPNEARRLITYAQRIKVFEKSNGICAHCGRKLYYAGNYTIEHIIPLSKGGKTEHRNLTALCYACNQEKKDDIVEPDWYAYMSKDQRKEVKELYQDYNDRFDWLSKTNLFQMDRFTIKGRGVIQKPIWINGQKCVRQHLVPTMIKVKKVQIGTIMNFLTAYKETLNDQDRLLILENPDEINIPFYFLEIRGKNTLMFSAYPVEDKNQKFMIYIDIFVSPNLKEKPGVTAPSIAINLMAIVNQIQHTLIKGSPGSLMRCVIRTPSSDKIGKKAIDELVKHNDKSCQKVIWTPTDNEEQPTKKGHTVGCIMMLFQGKQANLIKAMEEHGAKNHTELGKQLLATEQTTDQRIRKNYAPKAYHKPKHKHEGDTEL